MKKSLALALASSIIFAGCSTTVTNKKKITHMQPQDENKALVLISEQELTLKKDFIKGDSYSIDTKDQQAAICEKAGSTLSCTTLEIKVDGKPLTTVQVKDNTLGTSEDL